MSLGIFFSSFPCAAVLSSTLHLSLISLFLSRSICLSLIIRSTWQEASFFLFFSFLYLWRTKRTLEHRRELHLYVWKCVCSSLSMWLYFSYRSFIYVQIPHRDFFYLFLSDLCRFSRIHLSFFFFNLLSSFPVLLLSPLWIPRRDVLLVSQEKVFFLIVSLRRQLLLVHLFIDSILRDRSCKASSCLTQRLNSPEDSQLGCTYRRSLTCLYGS